MTRPVDPDHRCVPQDSVDALVADWQRVRPELDFAPVHVVSRVGRVRGHVDAALERVFAEHGLTAPAFAVLVTLARLDDAAGVSQRRLAEELGLTPGTVSVRMDRLVEQGLVERRADPADRRNARIVLTGRGRALFERVVPAHLANERRLLTALSPPEQEQLAALLRKLLVEYEGSRPPTDAPFRLGLTLAPAHVTLAMRAAVGLAPEPGLLVKGVDEHGAAQAAGVRAGDVLVRAGGRGLTSVAALYAAIADVAARRRLPLDVLRGPDPLQLTLELGETPPGPGLAGAATGGRAATDEHVL